MSLTVRIIHNGVANGFMIQSKEQKRKSTRSFGDLILRWIFFLIIYDSKRLFYFIFLIDNCFNCEITPFDIILSVCASFSIVEIIYLFIYSLIQSVWRSHCATICYRKQSYDCDCVGIGTRHIFRITNYSQEVDLRAGGTQFCYIYANNTIATLSSDDWIFF